MRAKVERMPEDIFSLLPLKLFLNWLCVRLQECHAWSCLGPDLSLSPPSFSVSVSPLSPLSYPPILAVLHADSLPDHYLAPFSISCLAAQFKGFLSLMSWFVVSRRWQWRKKGPPSLARSLDRGPGAPDMMRVCVRRKMRTCVPRTLHHNTENCTTRKDLKNDRVIHELKFEHVIK